MGRLTKTNWKNLDPWETCGQGMYCTRNCHEDGGCANGCPAPKNYRRLAEYEDTRLTPEEIEDLKRKYQEDEHEFCGQYGTDDCQFQYRLEKIKKERDYWKKEALKWASELGEQKLERGKNEGN